MISLPSSNATNTSVGCETRHAINFSMMAHATRQLLMIRVGATVDPLLACLHNNASALTIPCADSSAFAKNPTAAKIIMF